MVGPGVRLNISRVDCFQQVKLATGDENIKRRIVRSAEETTTFSSLEIADNTTPLGSDDDNDDVDSDDMSITTEWAPHAVTRLTNC